MLTSAFVVLAITFALPTFAQQKDAADPPVVQQRDLLGVPNAPSEFDALGIKMDEVFNRKMVASMAKCLLGERSLQFFRFRGPRCVGQRDSVSVCHLVS